MQAYEELLDGQPDRALLEGSMHFEEKSAVYQTLRAIAGRLDELQVPYAVAGGMALFVHGFRRFTEDVDVLVTRQALSAIHQELEGRGYVPLFPGSRGLRDAEHGVRVEFLVTGDFPGDGKPKPIAFPDPSAVRFARDGIQYVNLQTLVELKLASGMTNSGRLRDLADVQELIRHLALPASFAGQLNPYVREKFAELWQGVQTTAGPPE
ncbi:MAG: nucleotidyl transferase AbiEii/AbiGii toxin family protein [Pirellulales bacterium]